MHLDFGVRERAVLPRKRHLKLHLSLLSNTNFRMSWCLNLRLRQVISTASGATACLPIYLLDTNTDLTDRLTAAFCVLCALSRRTPSMRVGISGDVSGWQMDKRGMGEIRLEEFKDGLLERWAVLDEPSWPVDSRPVSGTGSVPVWR